MVMWSYGYVVLWLWLWSYGLMVLWFYVLWFYGFPNFIFQILFSKYFIFQILCSYLSILLTINIHILILKCY